jgi:hypothetical protein
MQFTALDPQFAWQPRYVRKMNGESQAEAARYMELGRNAMKVSLRRIYTK